MLDLPGDDGVADDTHAMRVGDHHGTIEKSGVFDPGGTSHLTVAVQGEPGGEDGVVGAFTARMNGGDTGADGTFSDLEFAAAGNQSSMTHLDAFNVGDGIV